MTLGKLPDLVEEEEYKKKSKTIANFKLASNPLLPDSEALSLSLLV